MTTDTYQQFKKEFKHVYLEAKNGKDPIIRGSAQNTTAKAALAAGHFGKASKWFKRAQETFSSYGSHAAKFSEAELLKLNSPRA